MFRRILYLLMALALPAFGQFIPVDTAIVVTVGPLIDDTDFKTLETAIAYNATGMSVDLVKSSGTASTKTDLTLTTGGTQDWTHLGNGIYEVEITAAQNDTEGNLQVVGVADGVLPFFSTVYTVVPIAVYNSLSLGTDNLQVDTIQVEGVDATNQINAEVYTALTDYDPPTKAELDARTLVAASYFDPAADTVSNVSTVATLTGHTPQTSDHAASIAAILADTGELQTRFGNMIEADAADWRFTTNALEQAPSGGGGGDATAANQTTILDRLAGVMDADHTLTSAVGDFDPATDSLEAIRVRGDDAWGSVGAGSGDTTVTHDTGGTDTFQVIDSSGNGIEDVTIQAYVKSEFDSDATSAAVRGVATTAPDGRWESPYLKLDAGTEYTLYFHKPGVFGPATATVTP